MGFARTGFFIAMTTAERKEHQAEFLKCYRERGTIVHAAQDARIGRQTVYDWAAKDEDFAEQIDDVKEELIAALERSMYERAVKGDTLAGIFLLKALRPNVYRENVRLEHSGPDGGTIPLGVIDAATKYAMTHPEIVKKVDNLQPGIIKQIEPPDPSDATAE